MGKSNWLCMEALLLFIAPACKSFPEEGALLGMTQAHNEVRQTHGLPGLIWSEDLAEIADEWSIHLAQNKDCEMEHRSGEPVNDLTVGENLYWRWDSPPPPIVANPFTVVESWASEIEFYDYENNTCQAGEVCGHYTQLVWNDTEEVGCAMETCDELGSQVWVCNYFPAGNWVGEWPY